MKAQDLEKNLLFNLACHQSDIDKTYLYTKILYEAKHQLPVNKTESTGLKHFNDFKAFVEYWNDMDGIYKILKNTAEINNEKY